MIKIFKSIINTTTIRQSSVTLTSTIINGVLGVMFFIFLARVLTPSGFAYVAITISVITVVADLADLGVNNSVVRFVPEYLKKDRLLGYKFLKFGLELKVLVWVTLATIGWVIMPIISRNLLNQQELLPYLYISLIGIGGAMLFSYAASCFQALEKFGLWSGLFVITNMARLLLVLFIAFLGILTAGNSLLVYSVIPLLGFAGALFFLPIKKILSVKGGVTVTRQFFSYSKWVMVISGCFVLMSRLDIFLAARFTDIEQTGVYSAASQLALVLPQLISSLGVITAPKFASFGKIKPMIEYYKKLQLLVIGLAISILLLLPLGALILPWILGANYRGVFSIYVVLILASVMALIAVPAQDGIRYYFRRPDNLAGIFITQLIVMIVLSSVLGYRFQAIGVAVGVLGASIINLIFTMLSFWWFVRRKVI